METDKKARKEVADNGTNDGTNNEEPGVDKTWLKTIVTDNVEKPHIWTPKEVQQIGPKKAESRIQRMLQQFYWDLIDKLKEVKFAEGGEIITQPSEDSFDKWYEDMGLADYTHKSKLMDIFNTIGRACQISEVEGYSEEEFGTIMSKILLRCMEEETYLGIVTKVIDEKYPGLASPFRSTPTIDEMQEHEEFLYRHRIHKLQVNIDTNIEEFADELAQIDAAIKTDFESLARRLNVLVIVGVDVWELTLYCLMSPNAPRFLMNALDYRANLHEKLAGDISTAKSKVLKIAKMIAPKMLVVDDTTKPTFEGVAPTRSGDDIAEGVIDWANDGVMIVEEFTNKFAKMPLFRRVMDGEYIQIFKKGSGKGLQANISMLTACNPDDDFFQEEMTFRSQIPFKEGVLSRFDVLIPLTATQLKNEILVDKIDLFGTKVEGLIDFVEVKTRLTTLAHGMKQIQFVLLTEEQKTRLRDIFKDHNTADIKKRIIKNRPLLILRDLETLARLVNVIATVNFSRRKVENGLLFASDEDIDKAIQLWENLLNYRVQLYARSSRNLTTISEEFVAYLARAGGVENWIPQVEVYEEFVTVQRKIGRSTFYKELTGLLEEGRIVVSGKRNRELKLVVK